MYVQRALVATIYFYQVRRSARLKSFSQNISPKLKLENFLLHETGKENTYRQEFKHPISDNAFKDTSRLLSSCLETIV